MIDINSDQKVDYKVICSSLFECLKVRDRITADHSIVMANHSYQIAKLFDQDNAELYYYGSLTHDIGKVGMPDSILKSSRSLTLNDKQVIREHVKNGVMILENLDLPEIIIDIARYHHERFNGVGYLEGINGYEIPLAGRIAAIADTYAALIVERPYQVAKSPKEALKIMENEHEFYDKEILDGFIKTIIDNPQV